MCDIVSSDILIIALVTIDTHNEHSFYSIGRLFIHQHTPCSFNISQY